MRRLIILSCITLLILAIALPAYASLVPMVADQWTVTPTPSPSPSPVPVAEVGNTLANPVVITSNTDLDPVSAAKLNDAMMNMAWTPVLNTDLSPFQDVKRIGGASVAVQPTDKILSNILSTLPLGDRIAGGMGWFF